MPTVAFRTFTGAFLQPCMYPEKAETEATQLAPGTYLKGTVLGQRTSALTAANDVQTITVTGDAGTFKLGFVSGVTADLPFSVTAAALQTALEGLPDIGSGNVAVTGGPGASAPLVVTFQGALAGNPQPVLTLVSDAVTGSGHAVAIVHTTTGRAAGGVWVAYDDTKSAGEQVACRVLKFDTYVDPNGYHFAGDAQWGSRALSVPAYVCGYFYTSDLVGLDAAGVTDLGKVVNLNGATLGTAGQIIHVR